MEFKKIVHVLKDDQGKVVYNDKGEKVSVKNSILEESNPELVNIGKKMISGNTEYGLKESKERFDLAVQGSTDGLWDWKKENEKSIWCSPRIFEMLGYKKDELSTELQDIRKILHPDDIEKASRAIKDHFLGDKAYDIEYKIKTNDNQYKWFRIRGKAVKDKDGNIGRMAGSIQDIHDLKTAERNGHY